MPEINVGAPVGAFVDWLTANFGPCSTPSPR